MYLGWKQNRECSMYLQKWGEEPEPTYIFIFSWEKKRKAGNCQSSKTNNIWNYNFNNSNRLPLTNEPLSTRLTAKQWKTLEKLNRETSDRIHYARLPMTINLKPFIVLPHNDFVDKETVNNLTTIAAIMGVVPTEADFIVKHEFDLSSNIRDF